MVNEIRRNGQVLHLDNYNVAQRPTDMVCSFSCMLSRRLLTPSLEPPGLCTEWKAAKFYANTRRQ